MSDSINFSADANYERYEAFADADTDMGIAGMIPDELVRAAMSENRHIVFMDSIKEKLCDLEADFKSASAELKAKIDACDDPIMKQQLGAAFDELENTWKQITHHPPGMHRDLGEFSQMWNERISNMRNGLVDATLAIQASEEISMVGAEALQISKPDSAQAVPHRGMGAHANLIGGTSGWTGIGAMEFGGKTVKELTAMMDSDPNGMLAHLDTLSDNDRQMAMQMIMRSLQNMNQMFSMMSNMMKSQHDTAKAAINNMRV